jgi:hypothetical protein
LLKKLLPEDIDYSNVKVWSQDESRIGQQGSLTRIWATKVTRPRKVKQRQFTSTYIYGAACHSTGQSFGLILPYDNTATIEGATSFTLGPNARLQFLAGKLSKWYVMTGIWG